jgi:hypothetical protein
MKTCDKCNGSGVTNYTYQDGDHEHTLDDVCTQCNGTGEIPESGELKPKTENTCPSCNGKCGDFPADGSPWEDCCVCKGTGVANERDVFIEAVKKANEAGYYSVKDFTMNNPFDEALNKPPELRPALYPDQHLKDTLVKKEELPFYTTKVVAPPIISQRTVYERAVHLWGVEAQIRMATEECGELIIALMKLERLHNGSSQSDIINEIADVEIMMEQLRYIFGDGAVNQAKIKKLFRLEERVKYGEGTA